MTTHTTYKIELPYRKPPLTANQRFGHWAQKSKIVAEVRRTANILARSHQVGPHERITVQLFYRPRDRRRRDPSNLMPSQKALLDGLVDARVVPDDCPPYVTETIPKIMEPVKGEGGKMWLEIRTDYEQRG